MCLFKWQRALEDSLFLSINSYILAWTEIAPKQEPQKQDSSPSDTLTLAQSYFYRALCPSSASLAILLLLIKDLILS
jgi:hypothetical protein